MTTTVTEDEDPMGVAHVLGLPTAPVEGVTGPTAVMARLLQQPAAPYLERAMLPNTNLETGIRYGIIAANSLDPEVIDEIQSRGKSLRIENASSELEDAIRSACGDYLSKSSCDDLVGHAQDLLCNDFYDDEPVHEFDIECPGYGRVKGQTTWLGGALHVWIFKSPFQEACDLCSPCVPNCGNLDSRNPDGYQCYDVPSDWRNEND